MDSLIKSIPRDIRSESFCHRDHSDSFEAAGIDQIEVSEIRFDIQSETMERDPAFHRDSHGGNLLSVNPDPPVERIPFARDAKVRQSPDNDFFKLFYVPDKLPTVFLKVKDRVNDELPWAMVGDISASLDVKDRNVQLAQGL
jgi:hypothetical protein